VVEAWSPSVDNIIGGSGPSYLYLKLSFLLRKKVAATSKAAATPLDKLSVTCHHSSPPQVLDTANNLARKPLSEAVFYNHA